MTDMLSSRRVVALVYDGLCTFEFGIATEIFALRRPEFACEWYQFSSVAIESGQLRARGGLEFWATGTNKDLLAANTIIIPGWKGADVPVPRALCESLQAAHKQGARLLSICSGAFVLAAAGLLDGKQATTHWRYADDFTVKFPKVKFEANKLYIEDGNIITSAGSSAGIDMCLHVVRSDFGVKIANSVARRLVMHSHRQGDQRQFIEQPIPAEYEANRLSPSLDLIRSQLDQTHDVQSLADHARMSKRTFQRKFLAFTGLPVGKWIIRERVAKACTYLETTSASLEDISNTAGFSSSENLQYHFRKTLDVSPGQYRKRFT